MRVDPSNARAQVKTAAPKVAERKPKPELQKTAEEPALPEVAKPSQQAVKTIALMCEPELAFYWSRKVLLSY